MAWERVLSDIRKAGGLCAHGLQSSSFSIFMQTRPHFRVNGQSVPQRAFCELKVLQALEVDFH